MDLVNSLSNSMNEKCGIIKKRELDVLDDSLAKWSPMASEINRDEFLGISFSHHMEILHKRRTLRKYYSAFMKQLFTNGTNIR